MADIPWMNEDGTFTEDWLTHQPKEHQAEPALQEIKGVPGLMKAYLDTKKMVGARPPLPKEGEEVAFFRKHFGAPEQATDYQLEKPQDWPKDAPFDEGLMTSFAEAAAEAGMPKSMAKGMYDKIMAGEKQRVGDALTKQAETMTKNKEASLKMLKETWGESGDKFDPNMELALRGFRNDAIPSAIRDRIASTLGVDKADDLKDEQVRDFLLANAPLAMICANVGKLTANDKRISATPAGTTGEDNTPPFPKSPEMYKNYKEGDDGYKYKQWFMGRGYDYQTGTWNKG